MEAECAPFLLHTAPSYESPAPKVDQRSGRSPESAADTLSKAHKSASVDSDVSVTLLNEPK